MLKYRAAGRQPAALLCFALGRSKRRTARTIQPGILCFAAILCLCGTAADANVLYDGSTGQTPDQQGWFYSGGASATQINTSTFTAFDSTVPMADQAGYTSVFHPLMPQMNRGDGFVVRFSVRVVQESHSSVHRAGFSVIAIAQDLKGVELAFWENEIWTQQDSPLFERNAAESVSFDTTASLTQYELSILGDSYSLSAAGMPSLSGTVKDYTAFDHTAAGLLIDPYEIPSFLFFGDATSSGEAAVELSFIEVVPEPASLLILMGTGAVLLLKQRRGV